MASSSSVPLHIIDDDDDDFDWEAATIEIDKACANTSFNSISSANNYANYSNPGQKENQKKFSNGKQSTLDRFVGFGPSSGAEKARLSSVSGNQNGGNVVNDNRNSCVDNDFDNREDDAVEESVGCVKLDTEAAKTWVYPVNAEMRDYQFDISQKALFTNTLVVLPTGLGKTLIAAVVIYNYFRWFPEGKIVFAAPSRPLVMQQIEACHNIVGIPQEFTIDLTGQTNPTRRAGLWQDKRVFFVTPQVLEKDINSGSCLTNQIVCLVIDEAHRATGNYSYCVAIRQLMAVPVQLRILALSATPGSKQQTIQDVIDNLQVSSLEYRDESDHDVAPYVHERKIELIQVPMGKDADQINDLILDVIRPYVARLRAHGVLQNRDVQTWSPHGLLNSREQYRGSLQSDGSDYNDEYREIDGFFGVLITLYHVRKLLSSHGIKPAFEMLEEKMHQGQLARYAGRNELLIRAKLLMQQSVAHGAPSPKLSKMMDILLDHFKNNDSQSSRVIIFSNFRGSVRDILNALAKVGDPVRATEFIGQSSAKTLKGQSQKIQQAVLEKFRSGKFNIIVATSIAEEGLDIMEVDLVICFDANVSPLRMIQRMGRTGRKHEGRVVVLACEGSELKGYLLKKSKNNSIKKHMRNGGLNSFNFHSSPRMIPHVIKPEVQLVELSIKQFIHRGKKVKDDRLMHSPSPITNLTNSETEQIAKYFSSMGETVWRPSLIAFPLFQSCASQVHNVLHSSRTGMLIDAMQHLQKSSLSAENALVCEDDSSSDNCCVGEAVSEEDMKGSQTFTEPPPEKEAPDEVYTSHVDTEPKLESHGTCARSHKVLFGSQLISIEKVRRVQSLSVSKLLSHSSNDGITKVRCAPLTSKSYPEEKLLASPKSYPEEKLLTSGHNPDVHLEATSQSVDIHLIPKPNGMSDEVDPTDGSPSIVSKITPALNDKSNNDFGNAEISPRLTGFIESGFVPESPIDDFDISKSQDYVSTPKSRTKLMNRLSLRGENTNSHACASKKDISSNIVYQIESTVVDANNSLPQGCKSATSLDEAKTPLAQMSTHSCSNDWQLNSGERSNSIEQPCKFRRLRKYGDHHKKFSLEKRGATETFRKFPGCDNQYRGGKKREKGGSVFIDEEAEVSPDVLISDDEEDVPDTDSCDDSFIDDRINPTGASTQVEVGGVDMMAVYRRSLLSQSPMVEGQPSLTYVSYDSATPRSRSNEDLSMSRTDMQSVQTPDAGMECNARISGSLQLNPDKTSEYAVLNSDLGSANRHDACLATGKRKQIFYQERSLPAHNLEKEFLSVSESADRNLLSERQVKKPEDTDMFDDDDQFFASLDLDAMEEQAAQLLRSKAEHMMQKNVATSDALHPNLSIADLPTFDLGI